ncbi:hypothetical protein ACQWF5_25250, partial [Salmonella enterica subsp. enterica serovar Infantis]
PPPPPPPLFPPTTAFAISECDWSADVGSSDRAGKHRRPALYPGGAGLDRSQSGRAAGRASGSAGV